MQSAPADPITRSSRAGRHRYDKSNRDSPGPESPKMKSSCLNCKALKIRCSRDMPCERCARLSLACIPQERARGRPKKSAATITAANGPPLRRPAGPSAAPGEAGLANGRPAARPPGGSSSSSSSIDSEYTQQPQPQSQQQSPQQQQQQVPPAAKRRAGDDVEGGESPAGPPHKARAFVMSGGPLAGDERAFEPTARKREGISAYDMDHAPRATVGGGAYTDFQQQSIGRGAYDFHTSGAGRLLEEKRLSASLLAAAHATGDMSRGDAHRDMPVAAKRQPQTSLERASQIEPPQSNYPGFTPLPPSSNSSSASLMSTYPPPPPYGPVRKTAAQEAMDGVKLLASAAFFVSRCPPRNHDQATMWSGSD